MRATPHNMKLLHDTHPQIRNVVVYSYETFETYSADSGDYFMMSEDECLKDSLGNDMVLVTLVTVAISPPLNMNMRVVRDIESPTAGES